MLKSTTLIANLFFPSFSLAHTYSFASFIIYYVHIKCLELLQQSISKNGFPNVQFHSASYFNISTHNKETIMQVELEEKVKEAVQS